MKYYKRRSEDGEVDLTIAPLMIGITPEEEEMFVHLRQLLAEGKEFSIGFMPEELEKYAEVFKNLFFRFMLAIERANYNEVH